MASQIPLSSNRINSYQLTLRAVGQVLDLLHVHSFEIEVDGKDFVVHGVSAKTEREVAIKAAGFNKQVKIFRPNGVTGPERQSRKQTTRPFAFTGMRFSETDLERLELRGQTNRVTSGGTPALPSLSQVMRALGGYVDHKRGRLIRISGCDNQIAIIYQAPFGEEKLETFTRTNLYDLWVHMYSRRRQAGSFERKSIRRSA